MDGRGPLRIFKKSGADVEQIGKTCAQCRLFNSKAPPVPDCLIEVINFLETLAHRMEAGIRYDEGDLSPDELAALDAKMQGVAEAKQVQAFDQRREQADRKAREAGGGSSLPAVIGRPLRRLP